MRNLSNERLLGRSSTEEVILYCVAMDQEWQPLNSVSFLLQNYADIPKQYNLSIHRLSNFGRLAKGDQERQKKVYDIYCVKFVYKVFYHFTKSDFVDKELDIEWKKIFHYVTDGLKKKRRGFYSSKVHVS